MIVCRNRAFTSKFLKKTFSSKQMGKKKRKRKRKKKIKYQFKLVSIILKAFVVPLPAFPLPRNLDNLPDRLGDGLVLFPLAVLAFTLLPGRLFVMAPPPLPAVGRRGILSGMGAAGVDIDVVVVVGGDETPLPHSWQEQQLRYGLGNRDGITRDFLLFLLYLNRLTVFTSPLITR